MKFTSAAIIGAAMGLASCGGPVWHSGPIKPIYTAPLEPVPYSIAREPVSRNEGGGATPRRSVARHQARGAVAHPIIVAGTAHEDSSSAGVIRIVEVANAQCSVMLTSRSLLDVNRAVPRGCGRSGLGRVNAWRRSGKQIDLFVPGGELAGRLMEQADGSFAGLTASGSKIRTAK